MTVYAITDTKKGRTGIVPTYLQVGAGAAFSNTGHRVTAIAALCIASHSKNLLPVRRPLI